MFVAAAVLEVVVTYNLAEMVDVLGAETTAVDVRLRVSVMVERLVNVAAVGYDELILRTNGVHAFARQWSIT